MHQPGISFFFKGGIFHQYAVDSIGNKTVSPTVHSVSLCFHVKVLIKAYLKNKAHNDRL